MLDFSVTFIITIINIAILFFILRAVLFKPVTKFMADRARRVQDSIEQTEKDRSQVKALLAQYQAQLKTADAEAEAIIRAARENARIEADRIIADSRLSAEAAMANIRKQLEMEKQAGLAAFRKEAAALVVAAAGRLVGRELQTGDNRQYADILLGEIAHSPGLPPSELSSLSESSSPAGTGNN